MKRIVLVLLISILIVPLLCSQEEQYDAALIPI